MNDLEDGQCVIKVTKKERRSENNKFGVNFNGKRKSLG